MPRKVLVTGANGFVARHMVPALKERGFEVAGVDVGGDCAWGVDRYHSCDLSVADGIRDILAVERPDVIVHLAAVSSVGRSWKMPAGTFLNNTGIFLNIMEAVRELKLSPRILSVGSSEEYGNVPEEELPIREDRRLAPVSPYAVARVAQEQLSRLYAEGFGLDVVMTRSFNQIGPGQRTDFVVPSFVVQLMAGRREGKKVVGVKAGDLSIVRDFLDVRDAVAAYLLLIEKGAAGEVYNICSGVGRALREVLVAAARIVGVEVSVTVDPERIRPADNRVIVGANDKMARLGWKLKYTLEASLADMVAYVESCGGDAPAKEMK